MITEKQMAALLDIKDAAEALEDVMEILVGFNYAPSFNEGALGKLSKIYLKVDDDIIWETCLTDIPFLKSELDSM